MYRMIVRIMRAVRINQGSHPGSTVIAKCPSEDLSQPKEKYSIRTKMEEKR